MAWIETILFLSTVAASAGSESFDPFVTATPVASQDFGPASDADYDGIPDGWTRRTGPGFPTYIELRIDRRPGHDAPGSLRIAPDGVPAALYSPPIPIDGGHLYVFEGFVRTQKLRGDAAVCSVSILDERMRRIARHLTKPVSGTHRDWVRVRIGPLGPLPEQKFLVIGCHLVRGGKIDLEGGAWFDDLRLGRTPHLSLAGRESRFLRPSQSTSLGVTVTGLELGTPYHLALTLRDVTGAELDRTDRQLAVLTNATDDETARPLVTPWAVPGVGRGFYRLEAQLRSEGRTVARRDSAFVVTDPPPNRSESPFGWSVPVLPHEMTPESFAAAAAEAGLGYVKLPLWRHAASRTASNHASEFVDRLADREIAVVGLLDPPPDDVRRKFAADWSGAGEIYSLPSSFWIPALAPVIARHGARVRHWQLGHDTDGSFGAINDLPGKVAVIQKAFERVGRNTQIGLPWPADRPLPKLPKGFLSILHENDRRVIQSEDDSIELWSAIRPLPAGESDAVTRATDLVRRMVEARAAGADAVFATGALDDRAGLIAPDGSPTELFLPWRTAALALRGAHDLGAIAVPGGSRSRAFASGDSATIVLWNDEPVVESFTPGGTPVLFDVWGDSTPLTPDLVTGRLEIPVGPSPVFVTGASAALLRWQSEVRLEQTRLQSQHGPQRQAIVGFNPFPQGVSGTVAIKSPRGWEIDQSSWPLRLGAGEEYRIPFAISLPADASLGSHHIDFEFQIQADRPYAFTVRREIQVGLGDIEIHVAGQRLPDGRLEVVQTLTNLTNPPEILNFRCDLFVPGAQRQRQYVVKLGPGRDTKRYYLRNADALVGQDLRLRAEQENGRRVLNYIWTVGEDEN